jgi:hypothetical protein
MIAQCNYKYKMTLNTINDVVRRLFVHAPHGTNVYLYIYLHEWRESNEWMSFTTDLKFKF